MELVNPLEQTYYIKLNFFLYVFKICKTLQVIPHFSESPLIDLSEDFHEIVPVVEHLCNNTN